MESKKFLDYEGFKLYHDELVKKLRDLTYDPQRMFDNKEELINKKNWTVDTYGRIYGIKEGMIVTIGNQIWQLTNADTFRNVFLTIGFTISEKTTAETLGWKIVGSTTEFEIDGHTLKLYNDK